LIEDSTTGGNGGDGFTGLRFILLCRVSTNNMGTSFKSRQFLSIAIGQSVGHDNKGIGRSCAAQISGFSSAGNNLCGFQ
jgi:hypothetical protein